ncbi:chloramphenicol acetyltransferase [Pedobacter rhizosphaerae]|uniref:Chloramphenicol O-acetyltransferase type A n=1 Tax=Pedobacter rhizosphaerae TaxID=390241 RepID=A0A1H9PU92_9SPHI|nr:chloramphenicol acetyltransferase [Pedobacter rhizosphaerae]SER51846.1 chloramphenicol O-acetyltransferase type A [Pedobacter rhizosphaerae]
MKRKIDINTWVRKDHFNFFNTFEEPFFGVTVDVDCTATYQQAKTAGVSFFLLYLHKSLAAANQIENFSYRIIDGEVWQYKQVNAATTVNRPDGTFGFGYLDFLPDFGKFNKKAQEEIQKVKQSTGLIPSQAGDNVIHYSALPWLNFKSLSHARRFSIHDSCPKISFGQLREEAGRKIMTISIHVNHALVDGYHVSQYVAAYQDLLSQNTIENLQLI